MHSILCGCVYVFECVCLCGIRLLFIQRFPCSSFNFFFYFVFLNSGNSSMCFLLLTFLSIGSNSKLLGHILTKEGVIGFYSLTPSLLGAISFKIAFLDLLLRKFRYSPATNHQVLKKGRV